MFCCFNLLLNFCGYCFVWCFFYSSNWMVSTLEGLIVFYVLLLESFTKLLGILFCLMFFYSSSFMISTWERLIVFNVVLLGSVNELLLIFYALVSSYLMMSTWKRLIILFCYFDLLLWVRLRYLVKIFKQKMYFLKALFWSFSLDI